MRFNYQARTTEGEIQTGTVEAANQEAAIETLQRYGLTVVSIEAISEIPFYARSLKIFQRVKTKELVVFYRQLSILFETGTPLLDAIRAVSSQIRNSYFKSILFDVETDIKGGESLSKALAKHQKIFSSFYIKVIESGEVTGRSSEALKYLAEHAEKEYAINSKIKGAFTYPIFILSAFVLIAILMLVYVVPQLTVVLEETGQKLPFFTKILIWASNFLRSYIWLLVIIIIGAGFGSFRALKTDKGREIWDKVKLKIPVLGTLFRKRYLVRFTENLSTLLKGGLSILNALKISSEVVGNSVFGSLINRAVEEVKKGGAISSILEKDPKNIPPSVVQMLKVGERSAKIDEILDRLSDFYQEDIDRTVSNLTQLIEPALIILLGGGVAFLVASILMPIYNIGSGGF